MLTRWDPFMEMQHLQDRLSHLSGIGQGQGAMFAPPVDIYESENAISINVELPGIEPSNVQINVENNVLTLRGERKFENEQKQEGYHRIERSYGSFSRSFLLPNTVDSENIEAMMNHGLLTVTLPKKSVAKPRSINVKTGGAHAQNVQPGALGSTQQGTLNQSGIGQGTTGQSTSRGVTGQSGIGQGTTGQSTGRGVTGQSGIGQGTTGQSVTEREPMGQGANVQGSNGGAQIPIQGKGSSHPQPTR